MIRQKELITKADWDCLVVLDACCYDYFEEVYGDYLVGSLQKVVSESCFTLDWLRANFGTGYRHNTVYISANPFIASKLEVVPGFFAGDHFWKVIDVWNWGWDQRKRPCHG